MTRPRHCHSECGAAPVTSENCWQSRLEEVGTGVWVWWLNSTRGREISEESCVTGVAQVFRKQRPWIKFRKPPALELCCYIFVRSPGYNRTPRLIINLLTRYPARGHFAGARFIFRAPRGTFKTAPHKTNGTHSPARERAETTPQPLTRITHRRN